MEELYKDLCKIYNEIGISDYSIVWGKNILDFFKEAHLRMNSRKI